MMATFFNHFDIVKYLVEHHADINIARKEVCLIYSLSIDIVWLFPL